MAKPKKHRPRRTKPEAKPRRAPAERRADTRLVGETLEMLREHDRTVSVSLREIGEHLLLSYFDDDEKLAQSNAPTKRRSYAGLVRLAKKEAGWKEEDFRRAVKLAIVARTLPSALVPRLSATRILRLGAIDDLPARVAFAAEVARTEMSEDDFRERILPLTSKERRGGRTVLPSPARLAAELERDLDRAAEADAFDPDELARVPATALPTLERRLAAAITRLEALLRAVRARL